MSKVMIQPADYGNVDQAVQRAFELFSVDLAGKKVLIKPNVLRSSKADEGIVTHPAVLSAVVRQVESQNPASIVVGDNPGLHNYGDNQACFEETGLMAAAGGYYENIGDDPVQKSFNPDFLPTVGVSRAVLEADVVISLPKFKTHGLTVVTGAVKNSYGILPGAIKARIHKAAGSPERFHEAVVDVFALRVPDLFIVDAVVGMEGNGPASPELRDIGCIIAGDNAVAVDSVIAQMMGLEPARLRFLQYAREKGLGDFDPETIEVSGKLETIPDFKVPPLGGEALLHNESIQDLITRRIEVRPRPDPELCTGCGTCVEQCPVSALSMDDADNLPVVDDETCIACFCCQEMCPEKAIQLA
ncbi:MAG: DUF362 domain-containing protein [Desulfobacteraceae bacterium]|nr:DUF362 domain-containing protein [Desulfobacteraceae bacterium]